MEIEFAGTDFVGTELVLKGLEVPELVLIELVGARVLTEPLTVLVFSVVGLVAELLTPLVTFLGRYFRRVSFGKVTNVNVSVKMLEMFGKVTVLVVLPEVVKFNGFRIDGGRSCLVSRRVPVELPGTDGTGGAAVVD